MILLPFTDMLMLFSKYERPQGEQLNTHGLTTGAR